jgi:hypothetical protein
MFAKPTGNILFISDLHCPYQHADALLFLAALKKKYNFSRIIGLGDELDMHAMSFHDKDPDLDSAGRELQRGREVLWELWRLFPIIDWVHSNHGSMAYRKALHHGVPRHLLLEYRDAIFAEKDKHGHAVRPSNRGTGWTWQHTLTFDVGSVRCKVHHGMSVSTRRNVEQSGMSFVQGHHHGTFEIVYHGTPDALNWGITAGCLIDDEALAFSYNKNTIKRPIIGCAGVIEGQPRLFPMLLNDKGRWTGAVP